MVAFIKVYGGIMFILIIVDFCILIRNNFMIKYIIEGKQKNPFVDRKSGKLIEKEENEEATPNKVREQEKNFNGSRSMYYMITQLISILPLLGILGTVTGLMQQVQTKDMDALYSSLDTTLISTYYGLSFAIALKFLAVVICGRLVDNIEIKLDNWFDRYSDAISQKNFEE